MEKKSVSYSYCITNRISLPQCHTQTLQHRDGSSLQRRYVPHHAFLHFLRTTRKKHSVQLFPTQSITSFNHPINNTSSFSIPSNFETPQKP